MSITKFCALVSFSVAGFLCQAQTATNNMLWKKTVSREVVIKSRPGNRDGSSEVVALTKMIVQALKDKKITPYSNFDLSLATKLKDDEMAEILGTRDDYEVIADQVTGKVRQKITKHHFDYSGIHKYRILEQWQFDPASCRTEIQIVGIAPVKEVYGPDGIYRGKKAIFWLHYDEIRPLLDRYTQLHQGSPFLKRIWNDYFSHNSRDNFRDGQLQKLVEQTIDVPQEGEDTVPRYLHTEGYRNTLVNTLFSAKYSGEIGAWADYDRGFVRPLAAMEFSYIDVIKVDTHVITDPVTNLEITKVIKKLVQESDHRIKVLERWSFDLVKGNITIRVEGIAALRDENEQIPAYVAAPVTMFWLKFDEVHGHIKQYDEYHAQSSFALSLWNSYFLSAAKPEPVN